MKKYYSKPLGFWSYFQGNRKVVLGYIGTLLIVLILLSLARVIVDNVAEDMKKQTEPFTYLSLVRETNKGEKITPEMVKNISHLDSVETIAPVSFIYKDCAMFLATPSAGIFFGEKETMKDMMEALNIPEKGQCLEEKNQGKMILSNRVLKNQDGQIGKKLFKENETVVGSTFDSQLLVGFVPVAMKRDGNTYVVIPKKGRLQEMNQAVKALIKNHGLTFDDEQKAQVSLTNMTESAYETFRIVTVLLTLICSMTTGITTFVHYRKRIPEMGVLKALGFSNLQILGRMTKEIGICTLLSIIGAAASILLFVNLFNGMVGDSRGFIPFAVNFSTMNSVAIVPLFMMFFSLVPTWVLLQTTDYVTLIQRGNG